MTSENNKVFPVPVGITTKVDLAPFSHSEKTESDALR
jgi:hypothetical protein